MADTEKCRDCRYWLREFYPSPICRRHPHYETRSGDEWCGEFKQSDEAAKAEALMKAREFEQEQIRLAQSKSAGKRK